MAGEDKTKLEKAILAMLCESAISRMKGKVRFRDLRPRLSCKFEDSSSRHKHVAVEAAWLLIYVVLEILVVPMIQREKVHHRNDAGKQGFTIFRRI